MKKLSSNSRNSCTRCVGKQIFIFRGFSSLCVSICRFLHIEIVGLCIFKQSCFLLPPRPDHNKIYSWFYCVSVLLQLRNVFMNEKIGKLTISSFSCVKWKNFSSVAQKGFFRFRKKFFYKVLSIQFYHFVIARTGKVCKIELFLSFHNSIYLFSIIPNESPSYFMAACWSHGHNFESHLADG